MRKFLVFRNPGSFLGIEWRTVFGPEGMPDPYQTSIEIGRLRLHIFWRKDNDPDYHDHPWDFTTLPLTSYREIVYHPQAQRLEPVIVHSWWPHRRPADYAHKVLGRADGTPGPVVTLVWRGPKYRAWGFWVRVPGDENDHGRDCFGRHRFFVPWKAYIAGRRQP